MATAFTTYGNGKSTVQTQHTDPQGGPGVIFYTADYDAAIQNLGIGDSVKLMTLPAGVFVEDVFVNVLRADAGGGGINVGDGTQAAGYGVYATLSATGSLPPAAGSATTYLKTVTTNARLDPKLTTDAASRAISIVALTAALTTLKVRVTAKLTVPA